MTLEEQSAALAALERTKVIFVRVTAAEHDEITAAASGRVAPWARALLLTAARTPQPVESSETPALGQPPDKGANHG